MPEGLIITQCAPTLAGMKTGSLFNCEYQNRNELLEQIASLNRCLGKKGLRMMVLGYPRKNRALIYLFRIRQLKRDLRREGICEILQERGYEPHQMGQCLSRLIERLKEENEFPHEIGCFLGYPSEDIRGFIDHVQPYKYVGTWQVYGDLNEALKQFELFRRCTESYIRQFEKGTTIERLAVA